MTEILYFGIGFVFLIIPLILTLFNIINLFKKKKIKENIIDVLTFGLGIGLTGFLYLASDFRDYTEALRLGGTNSFLEYANSIGNFYIGTCIILFN